MPSLFFIKDWILPPENEVRAQFNPPSIVLYILVSEKARPTCALTNTISDKKLVSGKLKLFHVMPLLVEYLCKYSGVNVSSHFKPDKYIRPEKGFVFRLLIAE